MAEPIKFVNGGVNPIPGSTGAKTQVPGQAATVSALANATGGVDAGNLVEVDIDDLLFECESEETPLMSLMLKSKNVSVASAEVDHYMVDEQRSTFTLKTATAAGTANQFVLGLDAKDAAIPRQYHTLLVKGIDGYEADGKTTTPGKDLMLFVAGIDTTTNCPVVRVLNGPKNSPSDTYCTIPAIPAGTKIVLLSNALYETQKEVDPDLIVPQPTRVYLQKRGMNQVVSDYFESQKKHIPFAKAILAQNAIKNFKRAGNRTLWAGRKSKFQMTVPKMGEQFVYTTEGVRWQFKRELQHRGKWTIEKLIALAKMFFTGEDVPKSALLLAGKNLLEELQCIDFSKHPEIQVSAKTLDKLGWTVTSIHTVFGDINIKREPTLDRLDWSNSGALIGEDRLVHYTRTTEHQFEDRVEGEEATRSGVIVWDALALKGTCHIWIDGEGDTPNAGSTSFMMWDKETAPTAADGVVNGIVVCLTVDCPGINAKAQNGQMWKATVSGSTITWAEYTGEINA